jgi:salicylate biosynthesis isochorismate synthase
MDILQALHPTPAVGGYPRVEAMEYIRQHENLDRGWYAAPVGWLDSAGNGDFLVALRSALVGEEEGRLFAGCGLVEDSNPAHEYRETRMKVSTMDLALRAVGAIPTAQAAWERNESHTIPPDKSRHSVQGGI